MGLTSEIIIGLTEHHDSGTSVNNDFYVPHGLGLKHSFYTSHASSAAINTVFSALLSKLTLRLFHERFRPKAPAIKKLLTKSI